MYRQPLFAVALLLGTGAILAAELDSEREPAPAKRPAPLLPGVQPGGSILVPNQWSMRPAGKQLVVGDFPVNLALHPTGRWLAVLHAGYGEHEVMIIDVQDPKREKIVTRVSIPQAFYGLCFAPDGRTLFASGGEFEVVHAYQFEEGSLFRHKTIAVAKETDKFIPAGLAVDQEGKTLFAARTCGDAGCVMPLESPADRVTIKLDKGSYPYPCAVDAAGQRALLCLAT